MNPFDTATNKAIELLKATETGLLNIGQRHGHRVTVIEAVMYGLGYAGLTVTGQNIEEVINAI